MPLAPHWMPRFRTKVEVASTMRALDLDLGRGRVQGGDQLLDQIDLLLDVGDDHGVGPVVGHDLAPVRTSCS